MTVKQREFMNELRNLLIKYNAEIKCTCDSDCYPFDYLYVSLVGQNDIEFTDGMGINATDMYMMLNIDRENEESE